MKIDVILVNVSLTLLVLAIVQTIFFFNYIKDVIANSTLSPLKDVADDFNHCSALYPRPKQYQDMIDRVLKLVSKEDNTSAKNLREQNNSKLFQKMVFIITILLILTLVLSGFAFYRKSITVQEFIISLLFILIGFTTEFLFFYAVVEPYKYISGIELVSKVLKEVSKFF